MYFYILYYFDKFEIIFKIKLSLFFLKNYFLFVNSVKYFKVLFALFFYFSAQNFTIFHCFCLFFFLRPAQRAGLGVGSKDFLSTTAFRFNSKTTRRSSLHLIYAYFCTLISIFQLTFLYHL